MKTLFHAISVILTAAFLAACGHTHSHGQVHGSGSFSGSVSGSGSFDAHR